MSAPRGKRRPKLPDEWQTLAHKALADWGTAFLISNRSRKYDYRFRLAACPTPGPPGAPQANPGMPDE